MYARGLSTRDIANLIEQMYGQKYSATSVSNLSDIAVKEIDQWKNTLRKTLQCALHML